MSRQRRAASHNDCYEKREVRTINERQFLVYYSRPLGSSAIIIVGLIHTLENIRVTMFSGFGRMQTKIGLLVVQWAYYVLSCLFSVYALQPCRLPFSSQWFSVRWETCDGFNFRIQKKTFSVTIIQRNYAQQDFCCVVTANGPYHLFRLKFLR